MKVSARSLRNSLAAVIAGNFASNGVGLASQLILMPIYIRTFGYEGFGIISFVQAVLLALDLGLGASVNRAVSEASCRSKDVLERTIRSFEAVYLAVAVAICLLVDPVSYFTVNYWLKLDFLSSTNAQTVLLWGIMMIGARWMLFFFQNALRGLERQHTTNIITVTATIVRTVAALVVVGVGSDLVHLFVVLFATSLIEATVFFFVLHLFAKIPYTPKLDIRVLRDNRRFMSQLWVASLAAVFLKQMDRILLAGLVSLETAGVYAAAQTAVQIAAGLVLPFVNAVYPRWTRLAALGDYDALSKMISCVSRAIAALTTSVCIIIVTVGQPALAAVTGTAQFSTEINSVLMLLALATVLNAPMQVQLILALATGRSHIPMITNIVGAVFLVPVMYVLIQYWGLYGAGVSWVVFNAVYFATVPRVIMATLEGLRTSAWYVRDNLYPFMSLALFLSPGIVASRISGIRWEYIGLGQLLVSIPIVYFWVRPIINFAEISRMTRGVAASSKN